MSFFMLLLFNDLSPLIFISKPGVVERVPIKSLARVPELPKFKKVFFFACKDPNPFPYMM